MSHLKSGFVLTEAVIAVTVATVVIVVLSGTFNLALKSALSNMAKIQAAYLAEEGIEAVRLLRDNSWNTNIATHPTGTTFYLTWSAGTWQSSNNGTFIDNLFERKIVLDDVSRDSGQNIVTSGGANDPNTKKVTVTVSWLGRGATTTRSLSTYLTNVFNN